MRQKERTFTKYAQNNYKKRYLLCRFKVVRNTFDKVLRNTERAYRRDLSINIKLPVPMTLVIFWDHLSEAGGRALGAMLSKIHGFTDVRYNKYTEMFNSCVIPFIDYCSGIWGFKQFKK